MKKNGFVSTSLIYTFFIIFLTMMLFVINSYSENRNFLRSYKEEVRNNFKGMESEITINYFLFNNELNEYESVSEILSNYIYNEGDSYCKNGGIINYDGSNFNIDTTGDDECFIYFNISGDEDA